VEDSGNIARPAYDVDLQNEGGWVSQHGPQAAFLELPTDKFSDKRRACDESSYRTTRMFRKRSAGCISLSSTSTNSGLEESLVHLVKMRRPRQINGCAYCLDVHSKDGPRPRRGPSRGLYVLGTRGRRRRFTSEREPRGCLGAYWTAVTRITEGHVPDAVFRARTRRTSTNRN